MTKAFSEVYGKVKVLCLSAICFLLVAIVFSGCTEKKELAYKANPVCEVIDKLPEDVTKSAEISYGNKVKLLGIKTETAAKNQIKISYYWQPIEDLGKHSEVFVHFVDADNNVLFQGDHPFCQKRPFVELKGKVIKETQVIDVPQSASGKEVAVKAGFYDPTPPKYDRLKVEASTGVQADDSNTRAAAGKIHF